MTWKLVFDNDFSISNEVAFVLKWWCLFSLGLRYPHVLLFTSCLLSLLFFTTTRPEPLWGAQLLARPIQKELLPEFLDSSVWEVNYSPGPSCLWETVPTERKKYECTHTQRGEVSFAVQDTRQKLNSPGSRVLKAMREERFWVTNAAALSTVRYSTGTPTHF